MPPVGFEPTISAGERPQTYALDRAAAGTGEIEIVNDLFSFLADYEWKFFGVATNYFERSAWSRDSHSSLQGLQ